ncbi:MAG: ATP-dependent DNA helicase DinG, partial [Ilumatobacter sp.]
GVVAVMDPRLGKARYRWDIVKALPPMKRTRHREEVETFLRSLHE